MSSYIKQEYDFVERMLKIIEQYESSKIQPHYEITLLLNCFVGLIILPQQLWYEQLSGALIEEKEWGISPLHIGYISKNETKNVKSVITHLRNSVSHYKFTAFSNRNEEISSINFIDKDQAGNKTFEATIPIKNLNKFIKIFSSSIMELMNKSK